MRALFAIAMLVALGACAGPPPSHALTVRHPELKCALIAFSGCGALVPEEREPPELEQDEDAGVDDAAADAR